MSPIEQFRQVVHARIAVTSERYGGLSARMFNRDGSRLGRVMEGADMSSTGLWRAMQWLSDNWPDEAAWPAEVPRPLARQKEPS